MKKKRNVWDVVVTRSLMEKDEAELDDLEKEAVKNAKDYHDRTIKEFNDANDSISKNCPMLCSGEESILIPSAGWRYPVEDMAYALEKLNIFYSKYHFRVVFDQTKEKFGTFRGYWRMHQVPYGISGIMFRIFSSIQKKIFDNVRFDMKRVEDSSEYAQLRWREIDKDEYDGRLNEYGKKIEDSKIYNKGKLTNDTPIYIGINPPTTVYFQEKDGKFFRSYVVHYAGKFHYEPTKHKFLYWFANACRRISSFFNNERDLTGRDLVMWNAFEREVRDIVNRCEHECEDFCEDCGSRIGEHGNTRCETHGWISFVCRSCALRRGSIYYDTKEKKWFKELEEVESPYQRKH